MTRINKADLSVIIPVYNELDNVSALYQEIVTVLAPLGSEFEVVFVDDGSTDGTVEKLLSLTKQLEKMRVIRHKGNFGQSAALVSGARAARYPVLVTMDGDGQNDPADIPELLAHWSSSRDVVLGHRRKRVDNRLRKISSKIGNQIRRWWLDDACPDTGCSLKLFSRDAFLALPHFNHLHRYLPALFKRAGFSLVNVSVNHRPRLHGVSKYGVMNRLFVGLYDLIGVRWLLKRPCSPEVEYDPG